MSFHDDKHRHLPADEWAFDEDGRVKLFLRITVSNSVMRVLKTQIFLRGERKFNRLAAERRKNRLRGMAKKHSSIPHGPLGQIMVHKETGIVGQCVKAPWPPSGRISEMSITPITLQTSNGAKHNFPRNTVTEATPQQIKDFRIRSHKAQSRTTRRPSAR